MANSIALVTKFQPLLDEIYQAATLTSDLESTEVQFDGSQTVKVLKVTTGGLNAYSRNDGFTKGATTATWESMTLTQDRGTEFNVDAMDDEETLGQTFAATMGQFIRTQVVPEVDAYRFAAIAAKTTPVTTAITTGASLLAAIEAGEAKLDEDEVPTEGRVLYITPTNYQLLKSALATSGGLQRIVAGTVDMNFSNFDGMKVVKVPTGRFHTVCTIGTGGFTPAGVVMNFIIADPTAVIAINKHIRLRVFAPEQNQTMDAYKFQYRIYHDCFVYDNKVKGLYVHALAA